MQMETRTEIQENFIGDIPFGFTLQMVKEQTKEYNEELTEINTTLSLPRESVNKNLRRFIENTKKIEKFLATPAEEIIKYFQAIYDFIVQQEKQKLKQDDVFKKIESEQPDFIQIIRSYPFLEKKLWGYRLRQYVIEKSIQDRLNQK